MYHLAQHVNLNHFIMILFFVLLFATLMAYANAKTTLFHSLKKVTILSSLVLLFAICQNHTFGPISSSIHTDLSLTENMQEQTTSVTSSIIIQILEWVKNAF
jgi:hypothetical protein